MGPLEPDKPGVPFTLTNRDPTLADGSSVAGEHHHSNPEAPETKITHPVCSPRLFGDYELIRMVARGGMGIVYQARHRTLNRTVALKMILSGHLASEEEVQRFYTGAEAAAQLDHPGIVPIFEVGEHGGQHFFSMAFVDGPSLAVRVQQGPLPSREAAILMQQVAEAVAYAHDQGVIHRDLKPANILLDRDGRPKVTDFGIAKNVHGVGCRTLTGQIMGTPDYMPPEQAAGRIRETGPAADVYSLGAVLYCLVTARPPFHTANVLDTLQQVLMQEPAPPRHWNRGVDADLETICLKCLQKAPARRYATAQALAEDLRRYLATEPIQARRVGALERCWRWCRRHPTVAVQALAIALLLLGGAISACYFALWIDQEGQRAQVQAQRAEQESMRAHQNKQGGDHWRYLAGFHQAAQAWKSGQVVLMERHLQALVPRSPGATDPRGFEWYLLELHTVKFRESSGLRNPLMFSGSGGAAAGLAFSPEGGRLASACQDGSVWIWDACTGRMVLTCKGHQGEATCVAFSADGKSLASGGTDRIVRIWDAASGKEKAKLQGHTDTVRRLAFSPDSRSLASVGEHRTVRVWDVASGREIHQFRGHRRGVLGVAFHPDGQLVVSCGKDGFIRAWDLGSGEQAFALPGHGGSIFQVSISRDGKQLASAGAERDSRTQAVLGEVTLWDLTTRRERVTLHGHANAVLDVMFSPDQRRLASASADHTVKLWDSATGQEVLTLEESTGPLSSIAFSLDGWQLARAGQDQVIKVWNATPVLAAATGLPGGNGGSRK